MSSWFEGKPKRTQVFVHGCLFVVYYFLSLLCIFVLCYFIYFSIFWGESSICLIHPPFCEPDCCSQFFRLWGCPTPWSGSGDPPSGALGRSLGRVLGMSDFTGMVLKQGNIWREIGNRCDFLVFLPRIGVICLGRY